MGTRACLLEETERVGSPMLNSVLPAHSLNAVLLLINKYETWTVKKWGTEKGKKPSAMNKLTDGDLIQSASNPV